MFEVAKEQFLVRIYNRDGRLIAQSAQGLAAEKALDFVKHIVDVRHLIVHCHWEIKTASQSIYETLLPDPPLPEAEARA
jgi:predicted protein tyrosine phosphatase